MSIQLRGHKYAISNKNNIIIIVSLFFHQTSLQSNNNNISPSLGLIIDGCPQKPIAVLDE